MKTVLEYLQAHPSLIALFKVLVVPVLAGFVLTLVRKHTAQEWKVIIGTGIGKRYPRLQGFLMIVESFAWIWEEAYAGLVQMLTGKVKMSIIPVTLPVIEPPKVVVETPPPPAETAPPTTDTVPPVAVTEAVPVEAAKVEEPKPETPAKP